MPEKERSAADRRKYLFIADQIKDAIRQGVFPPGHNIPSERDLAERYGANRQTIRAAILRLRAEGRLASDSLGTHVLSAGASLGDEDEFPGLLAPSQGPIRARGRLLELPCRETELDLPSGHEPVVYEHDVESPGRGRLQRSASTFHRLLVDRTPALAGALARLRAPNGAAPGDIELRDLHGRLRAAFPGVGRIDRVHVHTRGPQRTAEAERAAQPVSVRIERTFHSPGEPVLLRTVFHLDGSTALLPAVPANTGDPRGGQGLLVLTPAERAWLEAWTLPGATSRALATRARIILACDGTAVPVAAESLALSPDLVQAWLARFRAGGPQALRQRVKSARRSQPTGQPTPDESDHVAAAAR